MFKPLPVNTKITDTTGKIIYFGLPILYFLISVAFYLRTYDSAQIKITLIQIGGAVLLAAWLIKIVEEGIFQFVKDNMLIVLSLLLFLVSGMLSYLRSPFELASANELTRRIIYIGIAIIVAKEFNCDKHFKRLYSWLFFAAFVATIYGLIQFLDSAFFPSPPEPGLDPFIWRRAFGPRVFSTFGNPNFYGDFLVVMGPITLAMFMYTRRFHLLVLWLLILFNVYRTYSKGAWLGFGAGVVIFMLLFIGYFIHAHKEKIKKVLLIMIVLTLAVVSLGILKQLKSRTDSASFRVFTWLSTWEMINTNPWMGTGIGTFYVTYPSWRRPQIFFIEGRHNTETDHPENEYLEVWYDEGYVGIGIFLWIIVMFLMMSFQNLSAFSTISNENKRGDERAYYQLGLLTALSAQLIHNMVCVSLRFVSSGVFLWLLIGLIGALNTHHPLPLEIKNLPRSDNKTPLFVRRGIQVLVVIIALYCVKVFYGYFDADINHNLAIFYSKQGKWTEALSHYEKVTTENPSFIMAHYFTGNVYNDRWASGDAERSIEKYKDVWKLAPNYVQSHHQAGLIYLKWGQDERSKGEEAQRKGDLKKAQEHLSNEKEIWKKALREFELYQMIDPIFPLNYYRIAWIYLQMGQRQKAEEAYLAHIEYPEKLSAPPHNAWKENWGKRRRREHAETCVNVGNLYFMDNNLEKALEYYKKAVTYDSKSVNALKNLAVVYGRKNDMKLATETWQELRKLAPNDPDVKRMFQQR